MANTIRIYRDNAASTVYFEGSTVNPIPTNVGVATAVPDEPNRIKIVRTDKFKRGTSEFRVLFKRLKYTRIRNEQGDAFATRQEALDYLTTTFAQADPVDVNASYLGVWDAATNSPDIIALTPANGDWFYITTSGSIDPNADGTATGSILYKVDDIVKYCSQSNFTGWQYIPNETVRVDELDSTLDGITSNSSLTQYDIHVDANYTGLEELGTAIKPYKTLETAISASSTTEVTEILVNGTFTLTSALDITDNKKIHLHGNAGSTIKYANYSTVNGGLINYVGTNYSGELVVEDITFKNAGGFAIQVVSASKTNIDDCTFENNGWSGTGLSLVNEETGSTLGYNSSTGSLQTFYTSQCSEGGAISVANTGIVEITANTIKNNNKGIEVIDSGFIGDTEAFGFLSRNQIYNNVSIGVDLESSTGDALAGNRNITVYNNAINQNGDTGIKIEGGINNTLSLGVIKGNWNSGVELSHVANTRVRDLDLDNNNRAGVDAEGDESDGLASLQIEGDTIKPSATFITEIFNIQIHNTNLGTNTLKTGLLIKENVEDITGESSIIKLDNLGFIEQDYAIDVRANLDNLRLVIGNCEYIDIRQKNINISSGYYYEQPFSNHITQLNEANITVSNTGNIKIEEGVGGVVTNPYKVNELQALAHGTDIKVILKDSPKIQFIVPVSGCSINGSLVNSVLSNALVQLNDTFTNTTGFTSTGNPVTGFALANNNLTITLQDGTSYTVDVTTLGVDENKFVTSGTLSGSNLNLTMNDASIVTIDASNMINGSTLPARANDWYIAYGNNAGDEVTSAGVISTIKDKQPFYNGDSLEKGEEYIWTHDNTGGYMLGVWSGAESVVAYNDIFDSNNWSVSFAFDRTNNKVSETSSVGVDVATRYASGYDITNNTVLALRYGNDNHLYLLDISDGGETIIGKSNVAQVGDEVTIFFTGGNQPNAKFPVMVKRYEQWSIAHDFDNSENGEWNDGVETDTIIKSNMTLGQGEKMLLNFNYFGRSERIGLGYTGVSSGVSNAWTNIEYGLIYNASELLFAADTMTATGGEWTWNQNATYYHDPNGDGSSVGYWNNGGVGNLGLISIIYNTDNSVQLYHEGNGEIIANLSTALDGNPINIYIGFNEAHPTQRIPAISRQDLTAGSQPITTFAPDISNQSFDITENQPFNIQIALDSGSDIVNIYGEEDAPSWAVLNQSTGIFNGTAPAYVSGSSSYVINCKAANALGGITNFQTTLNVQEVTYTNTKSLNFANNVSSYLGGNAALITSMERAANGAGAGDAWSISVWVKGSTETSGQTIFYFGANDITNNGHIELRQTNHNGLKRLRLRYGSGVNYLQLTTPSGTITPSSWQHILVTYNGGTTGVSSNDVTSYYNRFKIFIDGVQQSTSNTHSNNGYNGTIVGQNYRFGRYSSGNYPKNMIFNQMAIWGSDQSSNISDIYNSGATQDLSLLTDAPEHYYEIETSTSTITDIIGTAHLVGYNFVSSDLVTDTP